jgi:hypothetical protein
MFETTRLQVEVSAVIVLHLIQNGEHTKFGGFEKRIRTKGKYYRVPC